MLSPFISLIDTVVRSISVVMNCCIEYVGLLLKLSQIFKALNPDLNRSDR